VRRCHGAAARVILVFRPRQFPLPWFFLWGGEPGNSLFFQGIGGSGFFFDQRAEVFCGCDVGFFEFQISFEICRHRLAVPVFNGACQTETLTGGGWLYWKLPCLQASVAKVNQPRPVSVRARSDWRRRGEAKCDCRFRNWKCISEKKNSDLEKTDSRLRNTCVFCGSGEQVLQLAAVWSRCGRGYRWWRAVFGFRFQRRCLGPGSAGRTERFPGGCFRVLRGYRELSGFAGSSVRPVSFRSVSCREW